MIATDPDVLAEPEQKRGVIWNVEDIYSTLSTSAVKFGPICQNEVHQQCPQQMPSPQSNQEQRTRILRRAPLPNSNETRPAYV